MSTLALAIGNSTGEKPIEHADDDWIALYFPRETAPAEWT